MVLVGVSKRRLLRFEVKGEEELQAASKNSIVNEGSLVLVRQ